MSVDLAVESEYAHGKGRIQNRCFTGVLDGAIRQLKVCRGCGQTKVAEAKAPDRGFDIAGRYKNDVVTFSPLCKPCRSRARKDRLRGDPDYAERRRLENAEARRRWLANPDNLEKARRACRAYYHRRVAEDREGVAEAARMAYRLRREREGRPVKPAGKNWVDAPLPRVSVDPFYRWMLAYLRLRDTSIAAISEELGINERRIRSILGREFEQVSVDLVDRALLNARHDVWVDGRRVFGLDDLYPSMYG